MRVSATVEFNKRDVHLMIYQIFRRTSSTEASADTVHTPLASHLSLDDAAAVERMLADFRALSQRDRRREPCSGRDSGNTQGVAVDHDGLALPATDVRCLQVFSITELDLLVSLELIVGLDELLKNFGLRHGLGRGGTRATGDNLFALGESSVLVAGSVEVRKSRHV